MTVLNDIVANFKKHGFFIVLALFSFYFVINTIKGDRGLFKYLYLKHKVAQAEIELSKYEAKKKDLEHKVAMLKEESLDLDYLEERARLVLNMVKSTDYVVLEKDIDKQ